jgi:protein TonB
LFDQTFVNAPGRTGKPWSVAVSLSLQTVLVAALLIAPLLHIASLGPVPKMPAWVPVQRLDLKTKPETKAARHPSLDPAPSTPRPIFHLAGLRSPTSLPAHIDLSTEAPEIYSGPTPTGSLNFGSPVPFANLQAPNSPVVRPKPVEPAAPSAPIQVGGGVQAARLIFGPRPGYPSLARATRTQGTVKMQATIARDGSIRNLQLLSGPPLLVAAAIEAVRQWRYRPTLLNGEPVEVITVIDVNFTLEY